MSNDGDLLRESARRCRRLALRARTDTARRQLFDWAERFEVLAADRTHDMLRSAATRPAAVAVKAPLGRIGENYLTNGRA